MKSRNYAWQKTADVRKLIKRLRKIEIEKKLDEWRRGRSRDRFAEVHRKDFTKS